jgi:hypothetical protein
MIVYHLTGTDLNLSNDHDFIPQTSPKKEETKTPGKVLRMSSATTKIKPVASATDKKVATISVASAQSSVKSSPSKQPVR